MNNTFLDYIDSAQREYNYTIKIATPVLSADMKGVVENCLQKYNLKSAPTYKETPIQQSPLDFPQLSNTKVYIADITVAYPITSDALRKYISANIGITEGQIAVYTENDPRHSLTDEAVEKGSDDYQPETKLGSEMKFDPEPAYGEAYNSGFLKELSDIAAKRKAEVVTNDLIPEQKVEKPDANDASSDTNDTPVIGVNPKIDKYFLSGE